MLDNFSSSAQKVILLAESLAKDFSHPSVGSEHLLLAMLKNEDLTISKELKVFGIKYKGFFDKTKHMYIKEKKSNSINYSLEAREIIQEAIKFSHKNKDPFASTDSLAISLLTLNNTATEMLENELVNIDYVLKKVLSNYKRKSELLSITDLHLLGVNNKDPLIGRENEIIQLIYSLSRRNKPNAILIGEPGVGKTAIVEELAQRLVNGEVPLLTDKLIYELDLASNVGGTKYRGEFEEKLKKIIKKVKEDGKAILFVDEIHNIIKAGGAEGAIDASNILKPYLARGEIQLIGATTLEEFNDSFEKDKALKRRFQIIDVNESSKEETLIILNKIKPIYEDYYCIKIKDDKLAFIIDLSAKYLINQRFPDKAIELLDNSCVIAKNELLVENIIQTMNKLYNISIKDEEKINKFIGKFENEIVKQNQVKDKIIDIFNKKKPNSLLFIGQSGSGKSKVAEIISNTMYNDHIINLKIDNYLEFNGVNKLISNGFSYNGENSSILVKKLKEQPDTVILCEGAEFMNNELKHFFQGVLEKGYFLDSKGNKINTSNALFVFSMNVIGKSDINFSFLGKGTNSADNFKNNIEEKIGIKLMNSIDDIVIFDNVDQEMYKQIVINKLQKENYSFAFELSDIDDVDQNELEINGGDLAYKNAKEIINKAQINRIKN